MVQAKASALYRSKAFAVSYTAELGQWDSPAYYERQALLNLIPPVRNLHILDAGCGPGLYSEWLLTQGATVTALDESPLMLAQVQQRLGPRIRTLQADLDTPLLMLADQSFDGILCAMVLLHIYDWAPLFKTFARLLKPQGWLLASTIHPLADLSPDSDYFKVEEIEEEWPSCGIWMPSYRRPIGDLWTAIQSSGLSLEQWVEPVAPSAAPLIRQQPWVLCLRLKKN